MSEPRKPAEILREQGEEVDAIQNLRLNLGNDPVFAHLATLSTALAINNILWRTDVGRKGKPSLIAIKQRQGKRDKKYPGYRDELTAWWDMESGVKLVGTINIGKNYGSNPIGIFPYDLDRSLIKYDRPNIPRTLNSSSITLVRPSSDVFGTPEMKVGVTAIHRLNSGKKPKIITHNETAQPDQFAEIIRILEQVPDGFDDESPSEGAGVLLTRTGPTVETEVTTSPSAHFGFHEALGVPASYMAMARTNFTTAVAYLDLPYILPGTE